MKLISSYTIYLFLSFFLYISLTIGCANNDSSALATIVDDQFVDIAIDKKSKGSSNFQNSA